MEPSSTTTAVFVAETMEVTETLPTRTSESCEAPPRSAVPWMVTRDPSTPVAGVTAVMLPGVMYVKAPAEEETMAPVSAESWMVPTLGAPSASSTTTRMSVAERTVAAKLLTVAVAKEVPPPSSEVPVSVTRVPTWPLFGLTFVMLPGKM